MRENARGLLREAKSSDAPLFIFYRSKPEAVILSLEEYQKMADMVEDYLDGIKAQEFEKLDKNKEKWYSNEEVEEMLGLKT
ncbi:MAG: hypothetical protein A2782_02295 [Candidatus Blackburnbacteria bacterium RIFCSPHIGHO2_01_FULL_43_15b]|uniref:Antitoxin n=1 Tax=Candidatus Blackburnbacteria bacterium RIFCSPHIGHO2_01_FULL_43_15b TaxID=1797513 RepID=A0A1G1V0E1_9BACT|nr:MAG: hypothetical protein A2782_02295 [Candidatus Blackburnbacteria bacterium RIFCSPHIGHO2_01_FULL_43_15b]